MIHIQRLFFNNKFDKNSISQLTTLQQSDSTIKVFDVFGLDQGNLPPNITLSFLPYLIDKQITLVTQSPYTIGTLDLKFNCLDYQENLITTENSTFDIYVNGDRYQDTAINGVIDLQFTVSQAMSIEIKINNGNGYMPFDVTIEVK